MGDLGRLGNHHHARIRSKTLAKAFSEITGITITHDPIQEGDVVEKLQTRCSRARTIYDGWINDSDLIGTHYRYGKICPDGLHGGEGQGRHQPGLDLKDFIGTSFTTAPDGSCTSCPTSSSPTCTGSAPTCSPARDLKDKFKAKYGYELGVPLNWRPMRTSPSSSPTT